MSNAAKYCDIPAIQFECLT